MLLLGFGLLGDAFLGAHCAVGYGDGGRLADDAVFDALVTAVQQLVVGDLLLQNDAALAGAPRGVAGDDVLDSVETDGERLRLGGQLILDALLQLKHVLKLGEFAQRRQRAIDFVMLAFRHRRYLIDKYMCTRVSS